MLGLSRGQVCRACDRIRHGRKKRVGSEERKPRVYKDEDTYTIMTRAGHSVKITEQDLRALKKLYCLEGLTINQVCREMRLPRRDFHAVKTAFGITKDDTPHLDEDLIDQDIDDLVADSLQEKKRLYFIKLQQQEITQLRKENNLYRQQEYMLDRIHSTVTEHMDEFARKYKGPGGVRKPELTAKDYMLEVPNCDLHLSKLAWEPEVGESYDYKIAEKRYRTVMEDVYGRAEKVMPGKILLPIGHDFFHTDTLQGTTTAGTPQDFDGRWQKQFNKGVELLVWTCDLFSQLAPVEGFLVPGNHDKMVSYYALMFLSAWFKDKKEVDINIDPKTRKYVEFGKNLIGFTHGDKERKRIFGNMQVEAPQAWGRTKFREYHIGHWHHESTKEEHGVIVRSLSTITGTDAYHFEHGFVGAIAKQQSFLWHKQKGLYEIWHTNI